jgi:hypothetical protein
VAVPVAEDLVVSQRSVLLAPGEFPITERFRSVSEKWLLSAGSTPCKTAIFSSHARAFAQSACSHP